MILAYEKMSVRKSALLDILWRAYPYDISEKTLMRELKCSKRTLYRVIQDLREEGEPISARRDADEVMCYSIVIRRQTKKTRG